MLYMFPLVLIIYRSVHGQLSRSN